MSAECPRCFSFSKSRFLSFYNNLRTSPSSQPKMEKSFAISANLLFKASTVSIIPFNPFFTWRKNLMRFSYHKVKSWSSLRTIVMNVKEKLPRRLLIRFTSSLYCPNKILITSISSPTLFGNSIWTSLGLFSKGSKRSNKSKIRSNLTQTIHN